MQKITPKLASKEQQAKYLSKESYINLVNMLAKKRKAAFERFNQQEEEESYEDEVDE